MKSSKKESKDQYGSAYFSGIYSHLAKEKKEVLATFFKLLRKRKSQIEKILDLGCGEGEFLQIGNNFGLKSWGVDISEYALKEASRNSQTKFFRLDLNRQKLPFDGGFFDAVTCFDLLEHLPAPDLVLTETYRVLKPGGIFFVTTPNGQAWLSRSMGLIFPTDKTHINLQGPDYWQNKIKQAGFKEIETKGCLMFGFPPVLEVRYRLKKLGIKPLTKPLFIPFFPMASTLFLFAKK